MAIYCVTYSDDDDWGESKNRFNTRPPADARLEEARTAGQFARLIRWQDHRSAEIGRVNADGEQRESVSGEISSASRIAHSTTPVVKETPQSLTSPTAETSASNTTAGTSLTDRQTRLQIVKLVLEIIAIVFTLVGGIAALIWKIK
jgi:hypothetical protein